MAKTIGTEVFLFKTYLALLGVAKTIHTGVERDIVRVTREAAHCMPECFLWTIHVCILF